MDNRIFSPGKLLLTSEYVVLDGALALAVPTRPGQELFFDEISDCRSEIHWQAAHEGKPWLNAVINYADWTVKRTNLPEAAAFILKTLKAVQERSSVRLQHTSSYTLSTNLQFPADFGLGSSSTLMNNLADWAQIDAFDLNETVLGGSGYDVAVAKEKKPILYQLNANGRQVTTVDFAPPFQDDLIFIHLNQKQDSREGIRHYRSKEKPLELIEEFSAITRRALAAESLAEFSSLMMQHEQKLSAFLAMPTVSQNHFQDCPSFVKSLGAWGGDFVMSSIFPGFRDYFSAKGFETVLQWKPLIG